MADSFNILDQSLDYLTANVLSSGESTFPRLWATGNAGLNSGNLRLTYFTARKSETVTQVRMFSNGTAAGATPTLVRYGLYTVAANGDLTLVANIASDTALFATQNTAYTRNLASPYAKVAGQRYASGLLVVTGATAPTVFCTVPLISSEMAQAPRLSASLTGQTDLPSSIAAGTLTDTTAMCYSVLVP